jgi:hypothetical protein
MRRVLFDRTMAERVEDFECGATAYAREVTEFVRGEAGQVWYAVERSCPTATKK